MGVAMSPMLSEVFIPCLADPVMVVDAPLAHGVHGVSGEYCHVG